MVTVDFETEAIENRPQYPPKPVGVAIRHPEGALEYLAWGHPDGNNCRFREAQLVLERYWQDTTVDLLFHNSKFDVEVAATHMDLGRVSWKRIQDTQFLLYLYDPHARDLSLKGSANRVLKIAPAEKDVLTDWIVAHFPVNRKGAGAFISKAPVALVTPYAIGDVTRTHALYEYLYPYVERNSMLEAYDRERKLMPILMDAERRGIRCDIEAMQLHLPGYEAALAKADELIRVSLSTKNLNIDSNEELADAIDRAGLSSGWQLTPTGRRSTSKAALRASVTSPELLAILAYRGALATCLNTFLVPWIQLASKAGGRLHTNWHQTRGEAEKGGTRTGRLSSSNPNLQNPPTVYEVACPHDLPPPPIMRRYLLPEHGHKWLKRDYDSQEIRVLAHFEDGSLMEAYKADPKLDPHQYASDLIHQQTSQVLGRKKTKVASFTMIYGGGVNTMAERLMCERHEAATVKELYLGTFPDVRRLMYDIKNRGEAGLPVRTVGGRLLYAEPGMNGRSFAYKLLNHLIQGSSADITKQAVINYYADGDRMGELLATVHDELDITAPESVCAHELHRMDKAMKNVPLDVELTSTGYMGNSWHEAGA